MAQEYTLSVEDLRELGHDVAPEETDLQAASDRKQEQSFNNAQRNLSRRNTDIGVLDHIDAYDHKLFQISEARNKAEAEGNYHEQHRLEALLDGVTSGEFKLPGAPSASKGIDSSRRVSGTSQAQGAATEEVEEAGTFADFASASDVQDAFGGVDKTDEILAYVNEEYDESEIKVVLKALESDNSDDAILALTVAQQRMQQSQRGVVANPVGFDAASAQRLSEQYAHADEVVRLSNAVRDGSMSRDQAMQEALKSPQVLATAQLMLKNGDVSFS